MKNKKANRKIKLILIGPNRDDALYESLKSKETKYFKIHPTSAKNRCFAIRIFANC